MKDNKTVEFETFKPVDYFGLNGLKQDEPSCFNGITRIKKYKVVIELITESDNVYIERLRTLYNSTTNHHERADIRFYAGKLGYDINF